MDVQLMRIILQGRFKKFLWILHFFSSVVAVMNLKLQQRPWLVKETYHSQRERESDTEYYREIKQIKLKTLTCLAPNGQANKLDCELQS